MKKAFRAVAVGVALSLAATTVAPMGAARAASVPLNLVLAILSLGAGIYSVARLATATVNDGGYQKEMLVRISDEAALFLATEGSERPALLDETFELMREEITRHEGAEVAAELTDLDLAKSVIAAAHKVETGQP